MLLLLLMQLLLLPLLLLLLLLLLPLLLLPLPLPPSLPKSVRFPVRRAAAPKPVVKEMLVGSH